MPVDSAAWKLAIDQPSTLVPPPSVFTDVLPSILLFGSGISLVVAPLTSTLMSSIPSRFSGLGSAINNALSRVGSPLLGAIVFIAISATFYATLKAGAPELDVTATAVRHAFPPLNPPHGVATPAEVMAARVASVDAFHQAMLLGAGLLGVAAAVSWFGLREADPTIDG